MESNPSDLEIRNSQHVLRFQKCGEAGRKTARHLSRSVDGYRVLLVYSKGSQSNCDKIGDALRDAGFEYDQAQDVREAKKALSNGLYSAVIVHQGAVKDAKALVKFCREARAADVNLVIIASLTDYDERLDYDLLDNGADDVVTDQHYPLAVVKRITRSLAFRRRQYPNRNTIRIGNVLVDFVNGRVQRDGEYFPMSPRVAKLLQYLVNNAGKTVPRLDILHWVWGDSVVDPMGNCVATYVCRLRKLIEPIEPDPKNWIYLETVRGRGYRLDLPDAND